MSNRLLILLISFLAFTLRNDSASVQSMHRFRATQSPRTKRGRAPKTPAIKCTQLNVPLMTPILLTFDHDRSIRHRQYKEFTRTSFCHAHSRHSASLVVQSLKKIPFGVASVSTVCADYVMIIVSASAFAAAMGSIFGSAIKNPESQMVPAATCNNLNNKNNKNNKNNDGLSDNNNHGIEKMKRNKGALIGAKFGALAGAFIGIRLTMQMLISLLTSPESTSTLYNACLSNNPKIVAAFSAAMEFGIVTMFGRVVDRVGLMKEVEEVYPADKGWIEFGVINDITNAALAAGKSIKFGALEKSLITCLFGIIMSGPVGVLATSMNLRSPVACGRKWLRCDDMIEYMYNFVNMFFPHI